MKNKSIFKSVYCTGNMMTVFIVSIFSIFILTSVFKDSQLLLIIYASFFKVIALYIMGSFCYIKIRGIINGKEKRDI